jgi:hypothetical protein
MRRSTPAVVTGALVAVLFGCGSGDAPAGDPVAADAATDEGSDAGSDTASEPDPATDGAATGDGYADADIGTGSIVAGGTVHQGFGGHCNLSKEHGAAPVLDPSDEEVSLQIGIDNVEDPDPAELAFTALSNRTFQLRGSVSGDGEFTSVTFGSPATELAHVDLILLTFTGDLADGSGVAGEVVCVVEKP